MSGDSILHADQAAHQWESRFPLPTSIAPVLRCARCGVVWSTATTTYPCYPNSHAGGAS